MRKALVLVSLTALAACSGGGPQTAGSSAPPLGAGSGGVSNSNNSQFTNFANPTVAKTYQGVGGSQVFEYSTDERECCGQQSQVFASNASTVRNSSISIAYDPRDAIFTLTVEDPRSGASTATRFQDPASRTNFGGSVEPQWGTSQLSNPNIRYLQAGDGDPRSPYSHSGTGVIDPGNNSTPPDGVPEATYQSTTLFYEVPGSTTKYVSYAGYLRNAVTFVNVAVGTTEVKQNQWHLERGAFAYGVQTLNSAVPTTGTGTYTGAMLGTMVYNPTLDGNFGAELPTFFQWIEGTSQVNVNFGTGAVGLNVAGTVMAPHIDQYTSPTTSTIASGTSFTASGTAQIDLVNTGGFTGSMTAASFGGTTNGAPTAVNVVGSSIDGAFYGPAAEEVGGGFRIVGGTPDERIDILGTFTGAKP